MAILRKAVRGRICTRRPERDRSERRQGAQAVIASIEVDGIVKQGACRAVGGPSMKTDRRGFIAMLAAGLVAPIGTLAEVKGVQRPGSLQARVPVDSDFPSLVGASGWLNSQPLTAAELRGKVVLIDFWTYTCINWRRSLPYVRAGADKYKDYGLLVIGVHSPEFEF